MLFNLEDHYKTQIQKIWDDYSGKFDAPEHTDIWSRGFACPKDIKQGAVIIIGLNPSFTNKAISGSHFYETKLEQAEIPYFKAIERLTKDIKADVCHLDLLFTRVTEQKLVRDGMSRSKIWLGFIYDQLLVSRSMLEDSNPKLIVIVNAFARHLIGFERQQKFDNVSEFEWMNYQFKFDDEIGTHRIIGNFDLPKTQLFGKPVFFTGMLSGQRALDLGSFERLNWHIKRTLDLG